MHLFYRSNNFCKAPMDILLCERVNELRHSQGNKQKSQGARSGL